MASEGRIGLSAEQQQPTLIFGFFAWRPAPALDSNRNKNKNKKRRAIFARLSKLEPKATS
jgi:hypothetical protein